MDLEPALVAQAVETLAQLDQPIHHRALWRRHCVRRGQQEHGAVGCRGQRLQLVGEPLHLEPGPGLLHDRTHAVEHQQRRLAGEDLAAEQGREALQPLVLERMVGADVGHLVRDDGRVEEPHRAQVREHAAVILAEYGDKEGAASCRGVAVEDLAGQDGLACAGRTLDHVEAALQEPAAQDRIETRNVAGRPRDLAIVLASIGLRLRHASSDLVPAVREAG